MRKEYSASFNSRTIYDFMPNNSMIPFDAKKRYWKNILTREFEILSASNRAE